MSNSNLLSGIQYVFICVAARMIIMPMMLNDKLDFIGLTCQREVNKWKL